MIPVLRAGLALTHLLALGSFAFAREPQAFVVGDAVRLRREDASSAPPHDLSVPSGRVSLEAFRDEVLAVQVVVVAGDAGLSSVSVDIGQLVSPAGSPPLELARFVEHYVEVASRSRSRDDRRTALAWSEGARVPDETVLGHVPDALVPIGLARPWCPYPLVVPAGQVGAVWIDVAVPRDAAPGEHTATIHVREAGRTIATRTLAIDVRAPRITYRPVSFFTYTDPDDELGARVGGGSTTERRFHQLLHAHHVEGLASLVRAEDVARLEGVLDGSLFTPAAGYEGPGLGVAADVAAIGTYGALGEPSPVALAAVRAIAARVPTSVSDLFLYAVDEQCASPRGPGFVRLLRADPTLARVRVGHTCSEDPSGQGVELVMVAAEAFDEARAARARGLGKTVWIYNGHRPETGALVLDAPATDARLLGWIAATRAVGRWFLWESTFWNDGNRGGHGPVDPFVTAESFHDEDGDRMLLDGLLVYPGRDARFPAHSLGYEGVLPSMRLKLLRRGIQDAAVLALARRAHPAEADAVAESLVGAALVEADPAGRAAWSDDPRAAESALSALRALVPDDDSASREEALTALDAGRVARAARAPERAARALRRRLLAPGTLVAVLAAAITLRAWRARRAARAPRRRADE